MSTRRETEGELTPEQEVEYLKIANELANPLGFRAEFLGDAKAVGVTGDHRAYTRVINLIGPPTISREEQEKLAKLSTDISNAVPIYRITQDLAHREDPTNKSIF